MHHVCCRIIFLDEPTSGGRPDTFKLLRSMQTHAQGQQHCQHYHETLLTVSLFLQGLIVRMLCRLSAA